MRSMRKMNLILWLLGCMSMVKAQELPAHIGTWQNADHGALSHIKMNEDGYAWYIISGKPTGGPSFMIGDKECQLTYKIDYSRTPHFIDFVVSDVATTEALEVIRGIFVFQLQLNQMWLCLDFSGGGRPSTFITDDTIVLKRLPPAGDEKEAGADDDTFSGENEE